jgi:hypothetical protein
MIQKYLSAVIRFTHTLLTLENLYDLQIGEADDELCFKLKTGKTIKEERKL